jgi:hypothetical protein
LCSLLRDVVVQVPPPLFFGTPRSVWAAVPSSVNVPFNSQSTLGCQYSYDERGLVTQDSLDGLEPRRFGLYLSASLPELGQSSGDLIEEAIQGQDLLGGAVSGDAGDCKFSLAQQWAQFAHRGWLSYHLICVSWIASIFSASSILFRLVRDGLRWPWPVPGIRHRSGRCRL